MFPTHGSLSQLQWPTKSRVARGEGPSWALTPHITTSSPHYHLPSHYYHLPTLPLPHTTTVQTRDAHRSGRSSLPAEPQGPLLWSQRSRGREAHASLCRPPSPGSPGGQEHHLPVCRWCGRGHLREGPKVRSPSHVSILTDLKPECSLNALNLRVSLCVAACSP